MTLKEHAQQWVKETKERPLPFLFNASCFLSVVIPLIVYGIARSRQYGYYYEHKHDSEYSLGALLFCYIWTLVVLAAVVYFANQHFTGKTEDSLVLRVLLLMFANMSLVGSVLSATNLRALDGKNWDGRVFSLFPSCMLLTYIVWTLIGSGFALVIFYKKYQSLKQDKQQREETTSETAYQRQTDDEEEAGMSSSSAAPPPTASIS